MIPPMMSAVADARRGELDRNARRRSLESQARASRPRRRMRLHFEMPRFVVASLRLLARAR